MEIPSVERIRFGWRGPMTASGRMDTSRPLPAVEPTAARRPQNTSPSRTGWRERSGPRSEKIFCRPNTGETAQASAACGSCCPKSSAKRVWSSRRTHAPSFSQERRKSQRSSALVVPTSRHQDRRAHQPKASCVIRWKPHRKRQKAHGLSLMHHADLQFNLRILATSEFLPAPPQLY